MEVTNDEQLDEALRKLDVMIAEGFEGDPVREAQFMDLALKIEAYEDSIPLMPIRQPQTLQEMIRLKMYQMQLKQKEVAKLLDISETRLSEVLKGKRKVNLDLAKRLYERLHIDAGFILRTAR